MDRKGFTLIELLAVIVIIGLLAVFITPNILTAVNQSKEASYNTLIKNIVTSSESYYEECEYGDLSDTSKYESYACSISSDNTITITLGTLANTGLLDVKDTKDVNGTEKKVVINPKNDKDISECKITITKNVITNTDANGIKNYKVTYKIENNSTDEICPQTY